MQFAATCGAYVELMAADTRASSGREETGGCGLGGKGGGKGGGGDGGGEGERFAPCKLRW